MTKIYWFFYIYKIFKYKFMLRTQYSWAFCRFNMSRSLLLLDSWHWVSV